MCRNLRENAVRISRGHHFVRVCAIEMHIDMSQEAFRAKFTGKMPNTYPGAIILCQLAQSTCTWTCHKRHFSQKFTGKMPNANPGASILCEPAQSTCTCHKRHFVQKLKKKKGTRIHGPPICASLRSRHAHGHVTQEVLRPEIYTENAKRFRYHLDWTPALNCYRKNPSVWPHRLGKNTISSPSFMSWQPASGGCRPSQKKTWLLSQGRRLLRSAWWKPTILVIGRYYSMSLLKLMVPIKLPLFPSHLQITIPSEPKVYNFAIITFMNRWSFEHIS